MREGKEAIYQGFGTHDPGFRYSGVPDLIILGRAIAEAELRPGLKELRSEGLLHPRYQIQRASAEQEPQPERRQQMGEGPAFPLREGPGLDARPGAGKGVPARAFAFGSGRRRRGMLRPVRLDGYERPKGLDNDFGSLSGG